LVKTRESIIVGPKRVPFIARSYNVSIMKANQKNPDKQVKHAGFFPKPPKP